MMTPLFNRLGLRFVVDRICSAFSELCHQMFNSRALKSGTPERGKNAVERQKPLEKRGASPANHRPLYILEMHMDRQTVEGRNRARNLKYFLQHMSLE
jgi:hypothetical protein